MRSEFLHRPNFSVSLSYIRTSLPIKYDYVSFNISIITYRDIGIKCEYATQNVNNYINHVVNVIVTLRFINYKVLGLLLIHIILNDANVHIIMNYIPNTVYNI